jgi:hypothetical protein
MDSSTPFEIESLRAKIAAGIRDAEEGRFVDDTDESRYIQETIARVRTRLAAKGQDLPPR